MKDSHNTSLSWAELAKKVVTTGIGSAGMAKNLIMDNSFKKELMNSVLIKIEKRKDDLMEILAKEVSKFLAKINVAEELSKALEGMVIRLNATLDFEKKKGAKGPSPRIKVHSSTVSRKR